MSQLLDPAFLNRLEALRRHLESEARSGGMADAVASRRGSGAEFREHRPYSPGDDLRRVDWMAFARTGEPVLKLYHAEEDTLVRVLLDASTSLGFGEPRKLDVARRLGAALAYLALAGSRGAQVLVARGGEHEAGLSHVGNARRGRRSFAHLCRELEAADAAGLTDLATAVDNTLRRAARPGLLVVLSDFLDGGPVIEALGRTRAAGHDVVLVQVLDPGEIEPNLEGDLRLEDSETGASVEVTADARALEAYAAHLAALFARLRDFAKKHRAVYIRHRTTDDLETSIRRVLSRAID